MDETLVMNKAFYAKIKNIDSKSNYVSNYLIPNLQNIFPTQEERGLIAIEESEDKKHEVMVIFCSYSKLEALMALFNSEELVEIDYDYTDNILYGDVDDQTVLGMINSEEYSDLFTRFRKKMTTVDIVLDKISMGKEIDEIDKYILANASK